MGSGRSSSAQSTTSDGTKAALGTAPTAPSTRGSWTPTSRHARTRLASIRPVWNSLTGAMPAAEQDRPPPLGRIGSALDMPDPDRRRDVAYVWRHVPRMCCQCLASTPASPLKYSRVSHRTVKIDASACRRDAGCRGMTPMLWEFLRYYGHGAPPEGTVTRYCSP